MCEHGRIDGWDAHAHANACTHTSAHVVCVCVCVDVSRSSSAKLGGSGSSKKAKGAATKAKVFVVTMRVGNVGITLTAATRVYLMEPCLDPSMEVQAAGRIHRLGQTRDVHVKRFCYRDSIDGAIVELHEHIRQGKIAISNNSFRVEALELLEVDK